MKKQEIDAEISTGNSVLIHFTAEWCAPCKRMQPNIEIFTQENPELKYFKIDVDELHSIASDFEVRSVPTLIAYKNGKQFSKKIGAQPLPEIRSMFVEIKSENESSPILETDAAGREKFWEDMGRP
jgi:thioredoxin